MSDATYPQVLVDATTCCPKAIEHPGGAWHNHNCPVLIAWAEDMKTNRPEGRFYMPMISYPYRLTITQEWQLEFDPVAYCAAHRDEYDAFEHEAGYADWEKPLNFVAHRESEDISGPYSEGNHYLPILKVDDRDPEFEDYHRTNPFADLIDPELVDGDGNKVGFDKQFAALLDAVERPERPVAEIVAELDEQLPLEVVHVDPRTQLVADARAVPDAKLEETLWALLERQAKAEMERLRGQRPYELEKLLGGYQSIEDLRRDLGLEA